jgi:hypothetical protein
MEEGDRESTAAIRARLAAGHHDPNAFRASLLAVPPAERDAWIDALFELSGVPDDGPELPRGCVPYLPCPVDVLVRMVEEARVTPSDVIIDVGSGIGRATTCLHFLTGAPVIGIEIQSGLVRAARELAARSGARGVTYVEGDAIERTGCMALGSVFFLYCPFSGDRLTKLLAALHPIARARTIRICCLDLPLPPCPWLTLQPQQPHHPSDLTIYRSTAPPTSAAAEAAGRSV